jgi:hypothetical protein
MFQLVTLLILSATTTFAVTHKKIENELKGSWKLVGLECDGKAQPLDKTYTLSFNGDKGAYISKAKNCTQSEPETYKYLEDGKISIKSGVRTCTPNPCEADLPATECGKETNPKAAIFEVSFLDKDTLLLTTSDPNSVDCIGPGQKKPATFTLARTKKNR